jgi:hypothetical protein
MKWWERFSVPIGKRIAAPYERCFAACSPEVILKKAGNIIDSHTLEEIKAYTRATLTSSGGFADKAGKADAYYTLFGLFTCVSLDMNETFSAVKAFIGRQMDQPAHTGVHMHCIAIAGSRLQIGKVHDEPFRSLVRKEVRLQLKQERTYNAFLSLLTCFYIHDYPGLLAIRKQLSRISLASNLPCSVLSAMVVLQHSFRKPVKHLTEKILAHYDGQGGFRATLTTPVPDLLSTAVALFALRFAGADLRGIRAGCLEFVDALYLNGGFSATRLDHDTDIEYTFYGLLALGALATPYEPNRDL